MLGMCHCLSMTVSPGVLGRPSVVFSRASGLITANPDVKSLSFVSFRDLILSFRGARSALPADVGGIISRFVEVFDRRFIQVWGWISVNFLFFLVVFFCKPNLSSCVLLLCDVK